VNVRRPFFPWIAPPIRPDAPMRGLRSICVRPNPERPIERERIGSATSAITVPWSDKCTASRNPWRPRRTSPCRFLDSNIGQHPVAPSRFAPDPSKISAPSTIGDSRAPSGLKSAVSRRARPLARLGSAPAHLAGGQTLLRKEPWHSQEAGPVMNSGDELRQREQPSD